MRIKIRMMTIMVTVMMTISIMLETLNVTCVNHKAIAMDAFSEDLGIRLNPHPFVNMISDPVFLDLSSSSRQDNQSLSQSAQW